MGWLLRLQHSRSECHHRHPSVPPEFDIRHRFQRPWYPASAGRRQGRYGIDFGGKFQDDRLVSIRIRSHHYELPDFRTKYRLKFESDKKL